MNTNMWTIYKHTNPINQKCYIGLTNRTPKERWRDGKGYTHKSGQHKFANAIRKYGWDFFTHEILETNIPTLEEANERERYWIKYYDAYAHGYNMSQGGSGSTSVRWKKVYQIELKTLKIIAEFDSVAQAARSCKEFASNIIKCCKRKQITARGYYWCYVIDYSKNWTPPSPKTTDLKKDIYQISKTDLTIIKEWHGINMAAKSLHINQNHIRRCCKNTRHSTGGYYWCYKKDYNKDWKPFDGMLNKKVKVRCIETGKTYDSIKEASKDTGFASGDICNNIKKKRKHVHYTHWEQIKGDQDDGKKQN